MTLNITANALMSLAPFLIKKYLIQKQWVKDADYASKAEIYIHSHTGKTHELFLPLNIEAPDYKRLVTDALKVLSKVEERPELLIYEDLITSGADTIRVRAPSPDGEENSISLLWGVSIVDQSRMLLAASAASVTARHKKGYYHPFKMTEVNDYLSKVRLGHTERGSFIVKLISPVDPQIQPPSTNLLGETNDNDPTSRKVTRNLALALRETKSALRAVAQNPDSFDPFEQAIENGVNGNLCDSLSAMIDTRSSVDVSINWSMGRNLSDDMIPLIGNAKYSFTPTEAGFLKEAARQFRSITPVEETVIQGVIKQIGKDSDFIKIVTILENQPRTVKVDMNRTDLKQAINAFANDQLVKVSGTLNKTGKIFVLDDAEFLGRVDPDTVDESDEPELRAAKAAQATDE